jgi:hypothetical protein
MISSELDFSVKFELSLKLVSMLRGKRELLENPGIVFPA